MKKILKITVITIGVLLLLWWGSFTRYSTLFNSGITSSDCGTVVSVMPGSKETKHRLVDELYLGVDFDNGTFKAINVSPTTYMSKSIGDKVCFESTTFENSFYKYLGDMFLGMMGLILLGLILYFIVYLFTED